MRGLFFSISFDHVTENSHPTEHFVVRKFSTNAADVVVNGAEEFSFKEVTTSLWMNETSFDDTKLEYSLDPAVEIQITNENNIREVAKENTYLGPVVGAAVTEAVYRLAFVGGARSGDLGDKAL